MTESEGTTSRSSTCTLVGATSRVADQELAGDRAERGPIEGRLRLRELGVQASHRGGIHARAAVHGEVAAVGSTQVEPEAGVVERLRDEHTGGLHRVERQVERPNEDVRRPAGERPERRLGPGERVRPR